MGLLEGLRNFPKVVDEREWISRVECYLGLQITWGTISVRKYVHFLGYLLDISVYPSRSVHVGTLVPVREDWEEMTKELDLAAKELNEAPRRIAEFVIQE